MTSTAGTPGPSTGRVTGQTGINSSAKLQFRTEVYDTDDLFDPAVPTTLTASTPRLYQVNVGVVFSGDTQGNRGLYITKGGTSVSIVEGDPEKTTFGLGLQTSVVVPLVADGMAAATADVGPSTSSTSEAGSHGRVTR